MKIAVISYDDREQNKDYSNPQPYFGTAPAALFEGFAQLGGHELHVVSCTMKPMQAPEKLANNIWFHSLHVPNIGWLRTAYQGCIRAVRHKLRQIQPQIVHGQGTERYCALSAVLSGFPNVLTIHGNMQVIAKVNHARPFSFLWLAARLERLTIPRTKGVVCITAYTRNQVSDLAKKTWVVPNAVEQAFFEVKPLSINKSRPTILCVGLVCPRKNQNFLINALDSIAGQNPFELRFLGSARKESEYGAEFLKLVKARPWCNYAGFADRHQLRRELSEATALIVPSLEDNCPMVVLEAMASQVPVAAANVGGVPELIDHGVNGLLFNPSDAQQIRESVLTLLRSESLVKSMTRKARECAEKTYQPARVAARHLEIYREILKSRS